MKIIKQNDSAIGFPYIAYLSENLSDHPALIVQLHGAGERGSGGSDLDVVTLHGFSNVVNDSNLQDCILLMPQCPPDSFWAARIESLKAFIDTFAKMYSADPSRIYLCGLSMGGFGTWYTAMAYPDYFAAILPCCGGGMAWNAETLKMPIWTFHGMLDDLVSPHQTMEMIDALKDKNPNFRFTLYEDIGHDCWTKAFSEESLQWLMSQHNAERSEGSC